MNEQLTEKERLRFIELINYYTDLYDLNVDDEELKKAGEKIVKEFEQLLTQRVALAKQEVTRERFSEVAQQVETEFQMGGLSGDIYEEFAWEIYKKLTSGGGKAE